MNMASTSSVQPANQVAPVQMTPSGAEIFHRAVKYVLTEWPSLNLAIEQGMGGHQAQQKQAWMCDHIAEIVLKSKDLDTEDYLAALVNQEFDTLIEDGSLEYNAKWIDKFHKDCLQGKEQEVLSSISQAAQKKQSLGNMRIPPPVCATQESSDDDDDGDDDGDDEMEDGDR